MINKLGYELRRRSTPTRFGRPAVDYLLAVPDDEDTYLFARMVDVGWAVTRFLRCPGTDSPVIVRATQVAQERAFARAQDRHPSRPRR